jgi:energy-coupling factor transporter ATP-binding protein EcfA2
MKELFLLRGLPGAGKTTLAKTLGGAYIEADQFFEYEGKYEFDASKLKDAHAWCQNSVKVWTKNRVDRIIVSNTFTQAWEMDYYFELAKKHKYRVYSLIVENRHGGVNEHGVPADKLVQMKNRFDVQLLPPKEFTLEDIFNDEKKEGIKKLIKEHKDGKSK